MDKKVLFTQIDRQALARGEKTAIEFNSNTLSYAQLKEYSDGVMHTLLDVGVKAGDCIGVYMNPSPEYVISIIGINKAGALFMPIEPKYPASRIDMIIKIGGPPLILTTPDMEQLLRTILGTIQSPVEITLVLFIDLETIEIITLESGKSKSVLLSTQPNRARPQVNGDDGCYILFTSGSTGTPKAIEGIHKSLSHFAHWEVKEFGLDSSTRIGQLAPISFDVSLRDIFTPLLAGGVLSIPKPQVKEEITSLIQWIKASQISIIHIVPSLFRLIVQEVLENPRLEESIRSLHYVLLAGEALYYKDVRDWVKIGRNGQLVNLYGPSETTLAKLFYRIQPDDINSEANMAVPLGNPISNTMVLILKDQHLCEVDEIGEIHIKTPFMTKGYLNDQALTKEKFIQNPLHNDYPDIIYKTGDYGRYLTNGCIAFAGRKDRQVKITGQRVELLEIESLLLDYPGIKQTAVTVVEQNNNLALAGYYTEDNALDPENLKSYLRKSLPQYMIPTYFVKLAALPLNLNGKINYRALPRPEELLYQNTPYVAPRSEFEIKMAQIWVEVLGLTKVGINNSFFEIGGHSLLAAQLVPRICSVLKKDITLKNLLDHNTIKKLAAFMQAQASSNVTKIAPLPLSRYYDISHAQRQLWLFHKMNPRTTYYNMLETFVLKGSLNVNALKKSILNLIERHEALRTSFTMIGGIPKQQVHLFSEIEFSLTVEDFTTYLSDIDKEVDASIRKLADTPFDLGEAPLLRTHLLKLNQNGYIFVFVLNHIVSDGWSMNVIFKEIITFYEALVTNTTASLKPLKLQCKEFAVWQNKQLETPEFKVHRAYWRDLLDTQAPPLKLPRDFTQNNTLQAKAGIKSFSLSNFNTNLIRKMARSLDTSNFAVLLSCLFALLHRLTGQTDILIGSPSAGRELTEMEDQIGLYVNTLLIRTRIVQNDRFEDLTNIVKNGLSDALEHQAFPFDLVLDDLGITPSAGPHSLIDVMAQYLNINQNMLIESELSGVSIEGYERPHMKTIVDLYFTFVESGQNITCNLVFSTNLFKRKTIDYFVFVFTEILQQALSQPSLTMHNLISGLGNPVKSSVSSTNINF